MIRKKALTDKRAYDLFPTDKAKGLYPTLIQINRNLADIIIATMDEKEIEQFRQLLLKAERSTLEYKL